MRGGWESEGQPLAQRQNLSGRRILARGAPDEEARLRSQPLADRSRSRAPGPGFVGRHTVPRGSAASRSCQPLSPCSRDEVKTKWSVSDFIKAFIKFHGHVYLSRSLEKLSPLREKLEEQFKVRAGEGPAPVYPTDTAEG